MVHRVELPSLVSHRARKRAQLRRGGGVFLPSGDQAAHGDQAPDNGREPAGDEGESQRAVVLQPVAPPKVVPAPVEPSVPRPTALRDSQARHQIQLLERRLVKMARLLDARDQESLSAPSAVEGGVASIYRDVQGLAGVGEEVKQKQALMSRIFDENLKLRERVTSSSSDAR